jgi:peptidase E
MAGAGPGTGPRSFRFHEAVVTATRKDKPRFAYVGAASGDARWFERIIKTMVFGARARCAFVRLTDKSIRTSEAKSVLGDADVVFISGGDVEEGMRVIEERGLASYFRELHVGGKVFEAVSAGSIMLGEHWVRFEDDDDDRGVRFDCLGIVPMSFDAHDEEDGWSELHALARLMPTEPASRRGRGAGDNWVCGLTSKCAATWDGVRLRALGGPLARIACGTSRKLADLLPEP